MCTYARGFGRTSIQTRVMIAVKARAGGLDPRFDGASSDETQEPSGPESLGPLVIYLRQTGGPYARCHK